MTETRLSVDEFLEVVKSAPNELFSLHVSGTGIIDISYKVDGKEKLFPGPDARKMNKSELDAFIAELTKIIHVEAVYTAVNLRRPQPNPTWVW